MALECWYASIKVHCFTFLNTLVWIYHTGTFTVLTMLDINIILKHQQQFCKKFVFSQWNVVFWIFILCRRGVAQQILIVLHFSWKTAAKAAKLLQFLLWKGGGGSFGGKHNCMLLNPFCVVADLSCNQVFYGTHISRSSVSSFHAFTMHLYILIKTNAHIYITIFSLYIMFTPMCFYTSLSSGRFSTCTLLSHMSL